MTGYFCDDSERSPSAWALLQAFERHARTVRQFIRRRFARPAQRDSF